MISVIVPVYKVEQYLDRCVESILVQTYRDFELLLVDDGSPDRCGVMCDEWAAKDSRIRVYHKPNGGPSDTRNFGLDRAQGDCVMFVDADDWISPRCLAYALDVLHRDKRAEIAVFGCKIVRNGIELKFKVGKDESVGCEVALRRLLHERDFLVSPWGKLYSRRIFSNLRFDKDLFLAEDEDILGELIRKSEIVAFGSEAHYFYFQRDSSAIHAAFSMRKYNNQMKACRHLCDVARSFGFQMNGAIRRREARDRMSLLRLMGRCERQFLPLRAQLRWEVLKRWRILLDKEVCTRDKIGLLALVPGYWSFGLLWSLYERTRRS